MLRGMVTLLAETRPELESLLSLRVYDLCSCCDFCFCHQIFKPQTQRKHRKHQEKPPTNLLARLHDRRPANINSRMMPDAHTSFLVPLKKATFMPLNFLSMNCTALTSYGALFKAVKRCWLAILLFD